MLFRLLCSHGSQALGHVRRYCSLAHTFAAMGVSGSNQNDRTTQHGIICTADSNTHTSAATTTSDVFDGDPDTAAAGGAAVVGGGGGEAVRARARARARAMQAEFWRKEKASHRHAEHAEQGRNILMMSGFVCAPCGAAKQEDDDELNLVLV